MKNGPTVDTLLLYARPLTPILKDKGTKLRSWQTPNHHCHDRARAIENNTNLQRKYSSDLFDYLELFTYLQSESFWP